MGNTSSSSKVSLHTAAKEGDLETVKAYIGAWGTDLDACDISHLFGTPLVCAAKHNQLAIAKALIGAGAKVNHKSRDYPQAALVSAAEFGHAEMVSYLLSVGADVNIVGKDNSTPLTVASARGYLTVVQILVAAGANIARKDEPSRCNALYLAARYGHLTVFQYLLKSTGLSVPDIEKIDGSLLYEAITGEAAASFDLVNYLIAAGADVTVVYKNYSAGEEKTLLTLALESGKDVRIIDALSVAGVRYGNTSNSHGKFAIPTAAYYGSINSLRWLISEGYDIHATNGFSGPALVKAAEARRHKNGGLTSSHIDYMGVCQLLLAAGVNIDDARGRGGWTALMQAIDTRAPGLVEFFLEQGADPTIRDNSGQTALSLAIENRHVVCVEILKRYESVSLLKAALGTALPSSSPKLDKLAIFQDSGDAMIRAGLYKAARFYYEKVLSLDPSRAQPYSGLGAACELEGKFKEALEFYNKALAIEPTRPWPLTHKTIVEAALGKDVPTGSMSAKATEGIFKTGFESVVSGAAAAIGGAGASAPPLLPVSPYTGGGGAGVAVVGVDRARTDMAEEVEDYKCPITKKIMEDPVLASDGYTYERTAITAWIEEAVAAGREPASPITKEIIKRDFTTNKALQKSIARFLRLNLEYAESSRLKAGLFSVRSGGDVSADLSHVPDVAGEESHAGVPAAGGCGAPC